MSRFLITRPTSMIRSVGYATSSAADGPRRARRARRRARRNALLALLISAGRLMLQLTPTHWMVIDALQIVVLYLAGLAVYQLGWANGFTARHRGNPTVTVDLDKLDRPQ